MIQSVGVEKNWDLGWWMQWFFFWTYLNIAFIPKQWVFLELQVLLLLHQLCIVQGGNLSSHPRDMFCKNFEANNYLITNLTHSKRAYNNSNTMPTHNYHCSIILQRPKNIRRCGCYVDNASLGACMGTHYNYIHLCKQRRLFHQAPHCLFAFL